MSSTLNDLEFVASKPPSNEDVFAAFNVFHDFHQSNSNRKSSLSDATKKAVTEVKNGVQQLDIGAKQKIF